METLLSTLEESFHEDFANVRIDSALAPADAASGVAAVTEGERISIAPAALSGPKGAHLVAHELAHVVQRRRRGVEPGPPSGPSPSHGRDPHEREADHLAGEAMHGRPAVVAGGAPVPARQFGLFDDAEEWLEEKKESASGWAHEKKEAAGAWVHEKKEAAGAWIEEKKQAVDEITTAAGEAVLQSKFVNAVADTVEGTGETIMDPQGSKAALQSFVNLMEEDFNERQDLWAGQYKDHPILGPLARANAAVHKGWNEFSFGVGQAAVEAASAIPVAVTHPLETIDGLVEMSKVAMVAPALIDLGVSAFADAVQGEPPEGRKTNLEQSWEKKTGIFKGLIEGYQHSVERGKPWEFLGRLAFDAGSLLIGAEEAKAASTAERAVVAETKATGATGRLAGLTDKVKRFASWIEDLPVVKSGAEEAPAIKPRASAPDLPPAAPAVAEETTAGSKVAAAETPPQQPIPTEAPVSEAPPPRVAQPPEPSAPIQETPKPSGRSTRRSKPKAPEATTQPSAQPSGAPAAARQKPRARGRGRTKPEPEVEHRRLSRGEPEVAPDVREKSPALRGAESAAAKKAESLPKSQRQKTVAASEAEIGGTTPVKRRGTAKSGRGTKRGPAPKTPARTVADHADEIGHELAPHGRDNLKQGGFPGEYHASHAEKQQIVARPNEPVAVTKPMCPDCVKFFQKEAKWRDVAQEVLDPDCKRIFHPDGSITEAWPDGTVMRFDPEGNAQVAALPPRK
jgi:hypothetical protein